MSKKGDNWVDYKEIKAKMTMETLLIHYGLLDRFKISGKHAVGCCPIHKGTNAGQFSVDLERNIFNCFGDCHGGGNVLDFVAKMEGGLSVRQAALLIKGWYGLGSSDPKAEDTKKDKGKAREQSGEELVRKEDGGKKVVEANPPLKFQLKNLNHDHPYFAERGIELATINYFGLGFCSKGLMAGRVAIPIHNQAGELVAYAGRWPGDPPEGEAKYTLPPGFKKSLVLFNFHRAVTESPERKLIVVEGFFDCFRVWQAGFKNVVGLMGSALSEEQEDLLVNHTKMVTLMLDQDEAGRKAVQEILPRLARKLFVRVIELPSEGDQPDKVGGEKLKDFFEGLT